MSSFVLTVGLASCSIFGSDSEEPGPAPPEADGGIPPVQGGPEDHAITIAISNEQKWLIQGQSLQIPVKVIRGKSAFNSVNVTVAGLVDGVTAAPLTIAGDEGSLELRAAATVKQGPFDLEVTATPDGAGAPPPLKASLKVFVRGLPGTVDTTFGTQGLVVDPFFRPGTPADVVVLPDGQIVLAGDCNEVVGAYACVARLDANGKIDTNYPKSRARSFIGGASKLVALPDNKILYLFDSGSGGVGVGRLKADGDRDPEFTADQSGRSIRPSTGCVRDVHDASVLANGDMFLAFDWDTSTNCSGSIHAIGTAKIGPDGTVRTNWFSAGYGASGWGGNAWPTGLTMRPAPHEELVYVGTGAGGIGMVQIVSGPTGANLNKHVPRAGITDGGYVGAVLLPNGNVLGAFRDSSSAFVAAFKGDGSGLDTSFGASGIAAPPAPGSAPRALLRQKDGKILLGVDLFDPAIFRMNEDGRVDTTFGTGGKMGTLFPQSASIVRMVIQPGTDRLIVLARPPVRDVTEITRIWL